MLRVAGVARSWTSALNEIHQCDTQKSTENWSGSSENWIFVTDYHQVKRMLNNAEFVGRPQNLFFTEISLWGQHNQLLIIVIISVLWLIMSTLPLTFLLLVALPGMRTPIYLESTAGFRDGELKHTIACPQREKTLQWIRFANLFAIQSTGTLNIAILGIPWGIAAGKATHKFFISKSHETIV